MSSMMTDNKAPVPDIPNNEPCCTANIPARLNPPPPPLRYQPKKIKIMATNFCNGDEQ
jgi:hypothetical protein